MAPLRPPSNYDPERVAKVAVGPGNCVELGEAIVGPMLPAPESGPAHGFGLQGAVSATGPAAGMTLSSDEAFSRIAASLRATSRELRKDLAQARRDSRVFFNLTCSLAFLGFFLVFIAATLALLGQIAAAGASGIASIVAETLASVYFTKDRELREAVEGYHNQLARYQELLTLIDVAETISAVEERDRLKRDIVIAALNVDGATASDL